MSSRGSRSTELTRYLDSVPRHIDPYRLQSESSRPGIMVHMLLCEYGGRFRTYFFSLSRYVFERTPLESTRWITRSIGVVYRSISDAMSVQWTRHRDVYAAMLVSTDADENISTPNRTRSSRGSSSIMLTRYLDPVPRHVYLLRA
jgi:hypothetical protein